MGIENYNTNRYTDQKVAAERKLRIEAVRNNEAKEKDFSARLAANWDEKDATAKLGEKYETTHGGRDAMDRLRDDKEHLRSLKLAQERQEERDLADKYSGRPLHEWQEALRELKGRRIKESQDLKHKGTI